MTKTYAERKLMRRRSHRACVVCGERTWFDGYYHQSVCSQACKNVRNRQASLEDANQHKLDVGPEERWDLAPYGQPDWMQDRSTCDVSPTEFDRGVNQLDKDWFNFEGASDRARRLAAQSQPKQLSPEELDLQKRIHEVRLERESKRTVSNYATA